MASYLNANDLLALSRKFAKNLNSYGFNIKPEDISKCELFNHDNDIGSTKVLGEHKFQLNINQQLCRENKTEFRKSLIYHELAHMIQYNEAFAQKVIVHNDEFGNTVIDLAKQDNERMLNNARTFSYCGMGLQLLYRNAGSEWRKPRNHHG